MKEAKDLRGLKFGKLTVIRKYDVRSKDNKIQWVCVCDCNPLKEIITKGKYLLNGDTKSCGCIRIENLIKRNMTEKYNKKYNEFELLDDYGIMYILNEQYYFDLEDYNKIKDYCWASDKDGYAKTYSGEYETGCYLHRLIMNVNTKDIQIDHINRNKKDNRKLNLRTSTVQENSRNKDIIKSNKSGITGVFWNKKSNKRRVTINEKNKSNNYYGEYSDFDEAVEVRLEAEKKYYGEFAPQKHLFKEYGIK